MTSSQESYANVLNLLKKWFLSMTTWIALKTSKKAYLGKI